MQAEKREGEAGEVKEQLFSGKNLPGRLARWYLTIQEFDPLIKFLPGGLPVGEVPLALLAFNLGVEAGQLLFIAVVAFTPLMR